MTSLAALDAGPRKITTYIPSLTLPRFVFEQPVVSALLPVVCGAGFGYSTQSDKPKRPWVFGPVWTALYAMMGYTAYLDWTIGTTSFDSEKVRLGMVCEPVLAEVYLMGATLYTIQLGINLIWMPPFFGLVDQLKPVAGIIPLTGLTGYLAYVWGKVDTACGWLSFTIYLSAGAGYLNNWDFSQAIKEDKDA
ncbi:benzodiazepine receptor family protein-like protein [Zopfia rhizophila CBS 207.26]|uniref:Benzodiazepine receptor family protein-like protein n=1 Tax=Zopfia rhizophila CBS 207.26 TaxID=1314779 RepID=A0A6A6EAD3_9PEZI|nr:benzodiazepine receptor family protein-like protein [Zopfia rhizophila CBS 207.26]